MSTFDFVKGLVAQSCPTLLWPHGLHSPRHLCPWDSPGKNTGVGCHALFQGLFPNQGLDLGLLHCGQILYHLRHLGSLCKATQKQIKISYKAPQRKVSWVISVDTSAMDFALISGSPVKGPCWGTVSSVQSLSHVRLFPTPWTAARQASLSITNTQSLLKLISIESDIPSNHLILCHPLLLLPSIFPSSRVFSNESTLRIR